MRQQRGGQRARRVSRAGVDDHSRRLVHHEKILVLEHDAQRNPLRSQGLRLLRRQRHADLLARPEPIRCFPGLTRDGYPPRFDKGLESSSGELGKAGSEPPVEPEAGFLGPHGDLG